MKVFRNKRFIKRNYECSNICACKALSPPDGEWEEVSDKYLSGMMMIYSQAGVEYWGYL